MVISIVARMTVVIIMLNEVLPGKSEQDVTGEYCVSDLFQPRCWQNEVIIMQSALYGRMRIGRCVEAEQGLISDPRYLGCSADVLHQVDLKCSGKSECEIRVWDLHSVNNTNCYKDLTKYLEAQYRCVKVAKEDRTCTVSVHDGPVHIPSSSSGCGTHNQPWILEAHAGQQTNIALVDFDTRAHVTVKKDKQGIDVDNCASYGYIVDKTEKQNVTICGSAYERERSVYSTGSRHLELVLSTAATLTGIKFLIRIEASGCFDLIPPQDAWFKRQENEAIVGCYATRQTWHLQCRDQKWTGVIGNCTQYLGDAQKEAQMDGKPDMKFNLTIVAIVGMALIVCLVIACIGVICVRRSEEKAEYKRVEAERKAYSAASLSMSGSSLPTYNNGYPRSVQLSYKQQTPTYLMYDSSSARSDDNYNASRMSADTNDPRYFVLDRDVINTDNLA